jgi:hypothetical protein
VLAVAASMQKELYIDEEYESGVEWEFGCRFSVVGSEDWKIEKLNDLKISCCSYSCA